MCKKNYSRITAVLNSLIYVIFVTAEIAAVLCTALGIISLIYKLIMSRNLLFLYGAKGNIFVVSVIVMIVSAVLSNLLDKKSENIRN